MQPPSLLFLHRPPLSSPPNNIAYVASHRFLCAEVCAAELISNACCASFFDVPSAGQGLLLFAVADVVIAATEAAASRREQDAAHLAGGARLLTRRAHAVSLLVGAAAAAVAASPAGRVRAEEKDGGRGGGEGVVGAIKSIFDPNEETKAGKVLPKAYLKAAREVVRTLRESLEEDAGGDVAKFRRGADSAKVSIREFLSSWRGQQAVAKEESYVALERAIRSLAEFYSKAGPFASLPQDVKNKILDDLSTADAYL